MSYFLVELCEVLGRVDASAILEMYQLPSSLHSLCFPSLRWCHRINNSAKYTSALLCFPRDNMAVRSNSRIYNQKALFEGSDIDQNVRQPQDFSIVFQVLSNAFLPLRKESVADSRFGPQFLQPLDFVAILRYRL